MENKVKSDVISDISELMVRGGEPPRSITAAAISSAVTLVRRLSEEGTLEGRREGSRYLPRLALRLAAN